MFGNTIYLPVLQIHTAVVVEGAACCMFEADHHLDVQALPNRLALIVNHENITQNWYVGNDRSMLVCNCLFRLGGAGALLSNR